MKNSQYEDFKYVIQDITHIYVGAGFTYGELQQDDEAPFKLRAVVAQYFLKEAGADTTIEEHLQRLQDTDLSYMVLKQLKARIKVYVWREADGKKVKKSGYECVSCDIDGLPAWKMPADGEHKPIVEEVSFKKLALMAIGL